MALPTQNVLGVLHTPDRVKITIRTHHEANQKNGRILALETSGKDPSEDLPLYRPEDNQFPEMYYHPKFRPDMDGMEQSKYLKLANDEKQAKELAKRGWLKKPPVPMNLPPPSEEFGELIA